MSKKESALYSGLNSGGCSLMGEDISPTLISRYETKTGNTQDKLNVITYRKDSHAKSKEDGQGWKETDTNDTLNAFDSGETRTPTLVVEKKVYDWHRCDTRMTELGDVCCTASAAWGTGGNNVPMVLNDQGGSQMSVSEDKTATLRAEEHGHQPITFEPGAASRVGGHVYKDGITGTVRANAGDNEQCISENAVVRRLTPMECERLQGFPDGWTDIGEWVDSKGKKHKDADSPRYKALGNSIALPFWQWMAERITKQLVKDGVEQPTMASLFDGIGGFPLVFTRCGVKPVWASEIEEFPMAVTKIRFPEEEE